MRQRVVNELVTLPARIMTNAKAWAAEPVARLDKLELTKKRKTLCYCNVKESILHRAQAVRAYEVLAGSKTTDASATINHIDNVVYGFAHNAGETGSFRIKDKNDCRKCAALQSHQR